MASRSPKRSLDLYGMYAIIGVDRPFDGQRKGRPSDQEESAPHKFIIGANRWRCARDYQQNDITG